MMDNHDDGAFLAVEPKLSANSSTDQPCHTSRRLRDDHRFRLDQRRSRHASRAAGLLVDAGQSTVFDELAHVLHSRWHTDAVVTRGARGAIGWQDGAKHRAEPPPVAIVDTTGARDTFTGAFAASLSEGPTFAYALRFGGAAGSLACTRCGAQTGVPTREEIDTTLAGCEYQE